MDLALELGRTVEELRDEMTEQELGQWMRYAEKKYLPTRRMEHFLANIARTVAASFGSTTPLKAFLLFDQEAKPADLKPASAVAVAQQISAITGGRKVIHIGRKKRAG